MDEMDEGGELEMGRMRSREENKSFLENPDTMSGEIEEEKNVLLEKDNKPPCNNLYHSCSLRYNYTSTYFPLRYPSPRSQYRRHLYVLGTMVKSK
jgi:hypothetical protein